MVVKSKRLFFVVYQDEALELGAEASLLLADLRYLAKHTQKDEHGYFTVENTFICKALGMNKRKLIYERNKLIQAGRIDYIHGRNQNQKSRYKLL